MKQPYARALKPRIDATEVILHGVVRLGDKLEAVVNFNNPFLDSCSCVKVAQSKCDFHASHSLAERNTERLVEPIMTCHTLRSWHCMYDALHFLPSVL